MRASIPIPELLILLFLAGRSVAEDPKPPRIADREYYFVNDELIRNKNGTLTWFYRTNHVGATNLKKAIARLQIKGLKAETNDRYEYSFKYDKVEKRVDIQLPPTKAPKPDDNVLILTFPAAYKDIVEEFLERFDTPVPQVHIEAKVVEVTLDSNLEMGVSLFFDRGGASPTSTAPGALNPNAFFRTFRSSARPSSFLQPFMSPDNTGLSLLFDDFGVDSNTITAQIEALQERGSARILSKPSIVATQGQLATLVTGQEIPILEIRTSGVSDTVTTRFKETGIRLDFMAIHIGREYVKLRVRVEVSSVTGFVDVVGASTSTQNPIVSQRNAETVVTVRDGMTLVIGGLYSISEIEDKAGVPILSDIPILGFLFSKTKKSKVKSELDFFITPSILRHRLHRGVFVPPIERKRLSGKRKAKEEGKPRAKPDPGKPDPDKEKPAERD